jgi:hypothetical protein
MSPPELGVHALPHEDLLRGQAVFLSASFPNRESPRFLQSSDPNEIAQAVVAAVRAVLSSNGRLVFGGHPTISPLVLMIAEEYLPPGVPAREAMRHNGEARVVVDQSEFFGSVVPEATMNLYRWGLAELVWTKADASERPATDEIRRRGQGEKSLRVMREVMLRMSKPIGAIFIGGMAGVEEEASLFTQMRQRQPTYFIGGPGGAARDLGKNHAVELHPESRLRREELRNSVSYPALMQRIVLDIGKRL